jgi:hypothetical protein
MTYNDEHWEELIQTIIDRIGMQRFLKLTCSAVGKTIQEIIDEEMEIVVEVQR